MFNLTPTIKNLAPHGHENTNPHKDAKKNPQEIIRMPFKSDSRSLIAKDA